MKFTLGAGQYFGRMLQKAAYRRFTLSESVYPRRLEIPRHAHERPYCCLLLEGAYREDFGSSRRTCARSTLVVHPSGEVHAEHFGPAGGRLFRIEPTDDCLEHIRSDTNVLDQPAAFQGGALADLAGRLYREFRRPDPFASLAIEGLAFELLAESARRADKPSPGKPPSWLVRTRELLDAGSSDSFDLESIARAGGVHPVHLIRSFRRYFGTTPADYVRRRRVERACRMLTRTNMPLVEIALAAGFADQSHFTRTFRRVTGVTPGIYRSKPEPQTLLR
jgi:AraC family transcriptional regulator